MKSSDSCDEDFSSTSLITTAQINIRSEKTVQHKKNWKLQKQLNNEILDRIEVVGDENESIKMISSNTILTSTRVCDNTRSHRFDVNISPVLKDSKKSKLDNIKQKRTKTPNLDYSHLLLSSYKENTIPKLDTSQKSSSSILFDNLVEDTINYNGIKHLEKSITQNSDEFDKIFQQFQMKKKHKNTKASQLEPSKTVNSKKVTDYKKLKKRQINNSQYNTKKVAKQNNKKKHKVFYSIYSDNENTSENNHNRNPSELQIFNNNLTKKSSSEDDTNTRLKRKSDVKMLSRKKNSTLSVLSSDSSLPDLEIENRKKVKVLQNIKITPSVYNQTTSGYNLIAAKPMLSKISEASSYEVPLKSNTIESDAINTQSKFFFTLGLNALAEAMPTIVEMSKKYNCQDKLIKIKEALNNEGPNSMAQNTSKYV